MNSAALLRSFTSLHDIQLFTSRRGGGGESVSSVVRTKIKDCMVATAIQVVATSLDRYR
jgi:hypothetical protein